MSGFSAPGAFADYIVVKEKYCWKLDVLRDAFPEEGLLYQVGALVEPIACAYNGMFITGGGFRPGAYIAIYGAGPIGIGALLLARAAGAAKIFVFDVSDPRNQLALAMGADYAGNPDTLMKSGLSPSGIIREMTGGHGVDMQIEAAGAAHATIPEIQNSFAPNGKMIFLGRHDGTAHIQFDPIVSQANEIMGARGHAGQGIFGHVIRMLASGRLPVATMLSARYDFDQALDAFALAAKRDAGKIMVCFD